MSTSATQDGHNKNVGRFPTWRPPRRI